MEDLNVMESINNAGGWLVSNQTLLLNYMVNIVAAMMILAIGFIVSRVVSKALNKLLLARGMDVTVTVFLSTLLRYGVITFTLIAALGRIGVQTASVIAVLGAAGLALALALQGSLSNLAAGVLLVTFRPFRAGEFVDLSGVTGTVLNVHIFSSTLRASDGKLVIIPNNKIISGNIINYSREPARRNEFIIGVAYSADVEEVKLLLRSVVESDSRILMERGIQIGLNELASSSLNFVVRCWCNSNDLQSVYWDLMENFKKALDNKGIGIPYPQMDIHLHHNKA